MNHPYDTALLVAVLFAAGIYLVLDRSLLRVLFGFLTLSNAANLAILAVSGDPSGRSAPVLDGGLQGAPVDPLPQALILTAIVIGFGVLAYLTLLFYRVYVDRRTADLADLEPAAEAGSKEGPK